MATVLVVDDEPNIRDVLRYALEREGFQVRLAAGGEAALAELGSGGVDLVVLDVMMPGIDGLEVCRRVRARPAPEGNVPILFLSSRAEEIDRVVGLELGSDDYIAKPFSPRELVARVRAVLRRPRAAAAAPQADPVLEAGGLGGVVIDVARHEVRAGGKLIPLTATEFSMLRALCERRGRVLSRRQLVDLAISVDHHVTERTVDSHVRRIRAKLRDAGADELVETVHGVGYKCRD